MPMSHFGRVRDPHADKSPSGKKGAWVNDDDDKFEEGGKNLWILKPVGLNRGQGIHVVNSVKKCKKLIREYCFGREVSHTKIDAIQE